MTREELALEVARLGVRSGDTLMVHASLRAVGPVEGRADGVIDALEAAVGSTGTLLMTLGARDDWSWINERPEAERIALLDDAEPFDALSTPADPDNGVLCEVFRRRPGTLVTDHPEGRFAARGARAKELLESPPWNDYYGPGSALDRLCRLGGRVLRLGADPGTTTVLHWAEYLVELPQKRCCLRYRRVKEGGVPVVRTVACLDDCDGIVAWSGDDYFGMILADYLASGRGARGRVGGAESELVPADEIVRFGVSWMAEHFKGLRADASTKG